MTGKRMIPLLFAVTGFLILIFDSRCALEGTRSGIDLCIRTVIPSMFPFLVLSMMITTSLGNVDGKVIRQLSAMIKIPVAASPVLLPAFFGGYPVGAKCAADLYNSGVISKRDAERLLAFCSNAGPSFLFGMVSAFFPDSRRVWQLWLIHVLGAVFTGMIYPAAATDNKENRNIQTNIRKNDLMLSALKAMGIISGWVILFRTVTTFLNDWILWILPSWMQVLSIGILELSNGCCELLKIENADIRFILCSCMLSLGGICVLFQTISVTRGLSLHNYYIGKLVQTMFSLLISLTVVTKRRFLSVFVGISIIFILMKGKNKGRNLLIHPV